MTWFNFKLFITLVPLLSWTSLENKTTKTPPAVTTLHGIIISNGIVKIARLNQINTAGIWFSYILSEGEKTLNYSKQIIWAMLNE